LVNPGFPLETRWAYERLAATRSMAQPLSDALRKFPAQRRASWDEVVPLMQNDFEAALAPTHPALAEIRGELLAKGAEAALLSGSGATVFGIFHDESTALNARDAISWSRGWWASAARAGTESLRCQESGSSDPLRVG
jgi:4-diphosphocytidyl-2-C-methyl-D-erythritol kinase